MWCGVAAGGARAIEKCGARLSDVVSNLNLLVGFAPVPPDQGHLINLFDVQGIDIATSWRLNARSTSPSGALVEFRQG